MNMKIMNKLLSAIICILTVFAISGCDFLSAKDSIEKTNNTIIKAYTALEENLVQRGKENYRLYGAKLVVNSENVGTFTYVYTDKRPDEMKYSDILIVEINNRTGKIEKCSAPDWDEYGTMPYELISSAMPIVPTQFNIDSDTAIQNAAAAHRKSGFIYNYVELTLSYKDGMAVYEIGHISLINNCIYKSLIDVDTGFVIEKWTEEL